MITITLTDNLEEHLKKMDTETNAWTMRAARGECGWICSDCCTSYPAGMPDACDHGVEWCTSIIKRDKEHAHRNAV